MVDREMERGEKGKKKGGNVQNYEYIPNDNIDKSRGDKRGKQKPKECVKILEKLSIKIN